MLHFPSQFFFLWESFFQISAFSKNNIIISEFAFNLGYYVSGLLGLLNKQKFGATTTVVLFFEIASCLSHSSL
jgi:hypothetical protein